MKKSFMTRVLATGLSLAMAFSLSAATNVTTASAAAKPTLVTASGESAKSLSLKVGDVTKIKANAATKKTYKISAAKASSSRVKAAVSKAGTFVAIRGVKATIEGKPSAVKVSFTVKKTGKTSKYTYTSKVTVTEENTKLTMTAEAAGAKKIAVTFNKAVDTAATTITVKKGAATPTITSTTFAADAKSADLVMGTKLTEGTYTVEVKSGDDTLTAEITVQDEKLTSFALVSSNLVADAKVPTTATIYYKALNQYDEPMTVAEPTVSCTFSNDASASAATVDRSGKITVTNINTTLAIPGTTGTIVIVDSSTGVNLNTTVTYQSKAVAAEATVYGIYSTKTEKLIEGNLTTGAKATDYAILINVKSQYGSDMTPGDIANSEAAVTYNAANILTDLKLDGVDSVGGSETEVTYDGATAFLIPLTATGDNKTISAAGTLSLTIVSAGKGVIASPTFTVDEAKIIKTLSAAPASTVYADEENVITVEAYDADGNAITSYDDLNAANLVATSDQQKGGNKLQLKKNADGTGTLYFTPDPAKVGTDAKTLKKSGIATIILKANAATSSDYLVKTINVTYYEPRQAMNVSGITSKTVTACAVSGSIVLDLKTLTYEDQYANTLTTDDTVATPDPDEVDVCIVDKDGIFVDAASDAQAANAASGASLMASVAGQKLTLNSIADKGSATLYFLYHNSIKANADKNSVSASNYDLKVTVSATPVDDLSATDLKLVVNNGNAVNVTNAAVTLYPSLDDSTTVDNHISDTVPTGIGVTSAVLVYVTGVVNGKTVVIPSSQYHLVTKTFGALGAYDADDTTKQKTSTQTVKVVVDSASGAQEITADVTVSNAPGAITTLAKASTLSYDSNANDVIDATDLIKGIKVKDQYGNVYTADATLAGKFTYKVTITGDTTGLKTKITGDSTQDIKIEVTQAAATKIPLTVEYTTLNGKLTFTQDIEVNVTH
jgi:hypothetical protein